MVERGKKLSPGFTLWLEAEVHDTREQLPGKVRQRVKRLLSGLSAQPYHALSKALDVTGLDLNVDVEIRRIRLEHWRIIYAINAKEKWVWVLAIRQRPPYDYQDLPELIAKLNE